MKVSEIVAGLAALTPDAASRAIDASNHLRDHNTVMAEFESKPKRRGRKPGVKNKVKVEAKAPVKKNPTSKRSKKSDPDTFTE